MIALERGGRVLEPELLCEFARPWDGEKRSRKNVTRWVSGSATTSRLVGFFEVLFGVHHVVTGAKWPNVLAFAFAGEILQLRSAP